MGCKIVGEGIEAPIWERRIRALCATDKLYFEKPEWGVKDNRPDDGSAVHAQVKGADGVIIPDLRVAVYFYSGAKSGIATYHYTLQYYFEGVWLRAFSIDIEPEWKVSHRCRKSGISHKGPHAHIGGDKTPWSDWWPLDIPYPEDQDQKDGSFYDYFKGTISLTEEGSLCLEPIGVHNGVVIDMFQEQLP